LARSANLNRRRPGKADKASKTNWRTGGHCAVLTTVRLFRGEN